MEFQFTEAEENFRKEVRGFLEEQLPAEWYRQSQNDVSEENWPFTKRFARRLAEKKWLGLPWPKEYSGQGCSQVMQLVFDEELAYYRAPRHSWWLGTNRVGPTIIMHGREDQKRQHLAGITSGEMTWCQGFTEPNAGSDLASLQCRAKEDGDDFVVNGEKMWTSYAQWSDWCVLLARTNPDAPKHRGISYFLLDMKTPGVTVKPILNMAGDRESNYLLLNNARINRRNLLGEKDRGWEVAIGTLNFERTGVHHAGEAKRILEELVEYARETKHEGRALIDEPMVRYRLAQMNIEINIARLLAYRLAWMLDSGIVPTREASTSKLFATEMKRRLANVGMQLLGDYGALRPGSKWAPLRGNVERLYVWGVVDTIAVGASEIQRNIIAVRGLGLPKSS